MIKLVLAAGKYPADIQIAVNSLKKRLNKISNALSALAWRLPPAQKKKIPGTAHIGIQIITDRVMVKMNTQYRDIPATTDVLSFSYLESGGPLFPHEPVGEIYISHRKAAAQARENNLTLTDELCVLAVHGALHVMGYDHERSPGENTAMQKAEVRALVAAGVAGGLTGRYRQMSASPRTSTRTAKG